MPYFVRLQTPELELDGLAGGRMRFREVGEVNLRRALEALQA